ncbi:MAG TPA: FAD-dependent oxidoreductase [Chthoniobacterales bacterium]|nr:FAD-dependent oxidoreductase [Chthoniobacterales bacterium]
MQSHPPGRPRTVAIIGAGPAGITAAYQLVKSGIRTEVFEAAPSVGGLARTIDLWNQKVDLGPHRFFSSDPRVNKVWLEVMGDDYEMVNRLTRIYYKGRFFYYPLKPFNALANLGVLEAMRCMTSYGVQRFRRCNEQDCFETWVVGRFGRRLFEIFFKTYSEKLWGIGCQELDADFAAQRIKKLSLLEAIKNSLFTGNGNQHKTLVDQFAYPHNGSGEVYRRMAAFVRNNGGSVECKQPVHRVLVKDRRAIGLEFENGEQRFFDQVISTMPLNLLVTRLANVPDRIVAAANSLRFRNTILVYLKVESTRLFKDNWLYIHSPELRTGRITNFRNWAPQLYGDEPSSILALEYWCNNEDPLWSEKDDRLIDLAKNELNKTGLTNKAVISAGYVHRIPRCYPVYVRGYKNALEPVEQYLKQIDGLTVIGRYGSFKYNNQDHSILMGVLAAENIAQDAKLHDLWQINTDYEYQESAVISKTGLVREPSKSRGLPAPAPVPSAA